MDQSADWPISTLLGAALLKAPPRTTLPRGYGGNRQQVVLTLTEQQGQQHLSCVAWLADPINGMIEQWTTGRMVGDTDHPTGFTTLQRYAANPEQLADAFPDDAAWHLRQRLANFQQTAFIDGRPQSPPDWDPLAIKAIAGELTITVALANQLVAWLTARPVTIELRPGLILDYFLRHAPFAWGYWGPYKRLYKLLELRADSAPFMAVALARIDRRNRESTHPVPCETVAFAQPANSGILPTHKTLGYLARRGRRYVRRLAEQQPDHYLTFAFPFLQLAEASPAPYDLERRWILTAVLLDGAELEQTGHGRGAMILPALQERFTRRLELAPDCWNQHLDSLRQLIAEACHRPDILAFALRVLIDQQTAVPSLPDAALLLGLTSGIPWLQRHALAEALQKPDWFNALQQPAETLLRILRSLQRPECEQLISAVFHTLPAAVQRTVLMRLIAGPELQAIREGRTDQAPNWRSTVFGALVLTQGRACLQEPPLLNLIRAAAADDWLDSPAQWTTLLTSLPLPLLLTLQRQASGFPAPVARAVQDSCVGVAQVAPIDAPLAVALAANPLQSIRERAWTVLTGPSGRGHARLDAWNAVLIQADLTGDEWLIMETLRRPAALATLPRGNAAQALALRILARSRPEALSEVQLLGDWLAGQGSPALILAGLHVLPSRLYKALRRQRAAWLKAWVTTAAVINAAWPRLRQPEPSRIYWRLFGDRRWAAPIRQDLILDEVNHLNARQRAWVLRWLNQAPQSFLADPARTLAAATGVDPELHQPVLNALERRGGLEPLILPLLESRLPAAMATAERALRLIDDREVLTDRLLMICDSPVREARRVGLDWAKTQGERLNHRRLLNALTEHHDPEVMAWVAQALPEATGIPPDRLAAFEVRVLRTRHAARTAKEAVKRRLTTVDPSGAAVIPLASPHDQAARIRALLELARSSVPRDREWAIVELTQLKLAGRSVPGLEVLEER